MRVGRLPERTDDLRADAIRELRWAMAGAGLTVDKVPLMTAVLALPALSSAADGVPAEGRAANAFRTVVAAARDLGDGVQARLLRASLGIDYAGTGRNLTARRTEFAAAHNAAVRANGGKGYVGDSARAAYDMEHEMLGALVTALGALGGADAEAPAALERPFETVEYDVTYRMCGRAGVEAEVVMVLRALVDGVRTYELQYYCGSDDGGPASVVLLEGGSVIEDHEFGRPGFRIALFEFPAPLRAGETHRLRFDTKYPGSPKPDTWFTLFIGGPLSRAAVRVTFDRAEVPARVWRVDGGFPEAGGGDPNTSEPLSPDSTGHVSASFVMPTMGLRYGIAWAWPE